ncbi:MAG: nicotinate-nucleotide adenylyltransferase [Bacteroidia bacterium]|nr:nicotinate-nucleotide adenylyltransferase [Bacteroidia bacterium]NNJ55021.1 nicotinate-nucleotide adenylyltransferase [Bacteroidia bacterium]
MKIGLFFGSFNPIHHGHLIIGQYMLDQAKLDEVWYVVSPQNPLKKGKDIMDASHRLKMVDLAVKDNPKFSACDVEFSMPTPSYTAYTLKKLAEMHPKTEFVLIMGTDNLQHLEKWKDHEEILMNYEILAYFREGFPGGEFAKNQKVRVMKGPMLNISATYIRGLVRMGRSIKYLVPDAIGKYMTTKIK